LFRIFLDLRGGGHVKDSADVGTIKYWQATMNNVKAFAGKRIKARHIART